MNPADPSLNGTPGPAGHAEESGRHHLAATAKQQWRPGVQNHPAELSIDIASRPAQRERVTGQRLVASAKKERDDDR